MEMMTGKKMIIYILITFCGMVFTLPVISHAQTALSAEISETAERNEVTADGLVKRTVPIHHVSYWDDGVTYDRENLTKGLTRFEISPMEIEQEDSQTLFIFDYSKRDLTDNDAISVYINNISTDTLNVSFVITPATNNMYAIPLDESAWLKAEEQNELEVIHKTESGFGIPAGFTGELYLPLSAFGSGESNPFTDVETVGLSFTFQTLEEEITFELGDILLLGGSVSQWEDQLIQLEIIGEDSLVVPNTGSIITNYDVEQRDKGNFANQVEDANASYSFFLADEIQGIQLSPDGELELAAGEEQPESLDVLVKENSTGTFSRKEISLEAMDSSLATQVVPAPNEVTSFRTALFSQINSITPPLRLGIFLVVFIFGGLVWSWWGTHKRNQDINLKQLKKQLKYRKRAR